jgi:hypothetical protein
MSRKDELLALAERVEALTKACDETDARVACALTGNRDAFVEQSPFNAVWCVYQPCNRNGKRLMEKARKHPFTASLDAAMSLVPEGWCVSLLQQDKGWAADLQRGFRTSYDKVAIASGIGPNYIATPALALTAASLRALAATEQ